MNKYRAPVLGVTGGLATGKTMVANEFAKLGACIIDADSIAHKLISKDAVAGRKIIRFFGKGVSDKSGEIDRKKLGRIVFGNSQKRLFLEKITHPRIIKEIRKEIRKMRAKACCNIIVVDAPLLFEAKIEDIFDKILVVYLPLKIQLLRLARRDGLSRKEALARVKIQMPMNKKLSRADYVIDNTQSQIRVRSSVISIFNNCLK